MTPPSTSESPVTSKETAVDEDAVMREDIGHDRVVDTDEKSRKHETPVDSESSDLDQPEKFKEGGEGGYGWVVVLTVLLVNMHTWGMNSAYSVFLAYYLNSNAFPGSSAIYFAFVGGLSISIALLFAPLATICIRKYGTRVCLLIGVLLQTTAFIGASFTTKIWHLILSQGIAFGAGMGFLFTGSVGLIPQWFHKKRSLANSIGTAGSGFGGLTYSLAANAMLDNLGLAWAFRVFAILAFVVNGICSFLARDRNREVGAVHQAFRKDLFKKPEVYLFLAWAFFSILGYIIVVFSLAAYAQAVGFSASQGSIVAAVFNLSQGMGRIMIGYFSDRVGRINVAALSSLIAALSAFFVWIFAGQHYAGLIVYSLFGCFAGCIWPCIAPVAVEVVGLQLLPSAMSVTWLVLVLPATFAEVIGLSLATPGVNGYLSVQVYTGVIYTAAFVSLWALRIWKMHTMEAAVLTEEEREKVVRNPDAVAVPAAHGDGRPAGQPEPKYSLAFITKACFSLTRV